jgi:hypothetical protein
VQTAQYVEMQEPAGPSRPTKERPAGKGGTR